MKTRDIVNLLNRAAAVLEVHYEVLRRDNKELDELIEDLTQAAGEIEAGHVY